LKELDVSDTPLYLLSREYDWTCAEEHTSAIKKAQSGIDEIRMAGIGHFPPDKIWRLLRNISCRMLPKDILEWDLNSMSTCAGLLKLSGEINTLHKRAV